MVNEGQTQSHSNSRGTPKQQNRAENGEKVNDMFSPRFRSVAAMAGWDEEALIIASLVVEDTPDRELKQRKRSNLQFKTPPTSSRRKRRVQRKSPVKIPVVTLDLDEDETAIEVSGKQKIEPKINANNAKKARVDELKGQTSVSSLSSDIPCLDRLREELSCAICLEICFEPSTTPCGHSFCKKCLKSAADKCGKRCPKCRQLISNGRSCTVNTVLWNTIQLLFPKDVESRKKTSKASPESTSRYGLRNRHIEALNSSPEDEHQNNRRRRFHQNPMNNNPSSSRPSVILPRRVGGGGDVIPRRRRGGGLTQDEDAAMALRLQREEFMEAFRGSDEQQNNRSSAQVNIARANLRAMASRAINLRVRSRQA